MNQSLKIVFHHLRLRSMPVMMLGLLSVASPAAFAADGTLDERVNRLEKQLSGQGLVDLYLRLEALQQEVQLLRGEVEEQSHIIRGLKQRQQDLYLDIDRRLSQRESAGVAPVAPTTPVVPTVPATGVPVTPTVPVGPQTGTPAVTPRIPVGIVDPVAEESAYRAAFNLLKEGRYAPAMSRFRDFIAKYPASGYADNAQYWIGEANYVTRAFEQAIVEFKAVLDNYPASTKQADALLKLGYSYHELKDTTNAVAILNTLRTRFPSSTAARLAEKRLQEINTGTP